MPAAGYPFHALRVAGLDRRNPLKAARAVLWAAAATARARRILRAMRPDVVLGGGGYVAAPAGLAARSLRVPLVLTEADSHLGITNRMLAPFAARVFLSFGLPDREGAKWVVTGRPVPAGTADADRAAARARFGIDDDRECLLVFGGSLGALRLNEAALDAFGSAAPCWVLHACGRRDYDDLARRLGELGSPGPLQAASLHHAVRRRVRGRRPGDGTGGRLGLRALGGWASVDPRPVPARDRRPPDEERPLGGARRRGGGRARRRARRPAARARGGRPTGVVRAAPDNAARGPRARAAGRRGADRSRDSHVDLQVMVLTSRS